MIDISNTTVLNDIELWGGEPCTYLWDNGSIAQHANICPGAHWVEVTDQFNCTLREDFEIPEYIVSLDPPSVLVECNIENLDIELEAIVSGATEPYSFDWSNGLTDNPINIGLSPSNLDLSIVDANGCIKDTSLTILSITEECVPNIFSPNGDNLNDTWNLEDTFLFSDSEVKVYGRYGKIIYQSVGYSSEWDGTNQSGRNVPAGYIFILLKLVMDLNQLMELLQFLR